MRSAVAVILALAGVAHAEDSLGVGAAVGAGGQGAATYGALELRLDAAWHGARIGLGARGVWLDGTFRRSDWDSASDAVGVLRLFEVRSEHVALAAGALAPVVIAHVADGERAALDDHPRTGAHASAAVGDVAVELLADDVVDPAATGGAVAWQVTPRWSARAAAMIDPGPARGATELAVARTWDASAEVGGGVVVEPRFGASAVAFAGIAREVRGARVIASADVRAGTGTVGGAFGPLYRLERTAIWDHAEAGLGVGASANVVARAGWFGASARLRPGRGAVAAITAGAPMGRWLQAGGWIAAERGAIAGAGELRLAWARRLSSALEVARMYDTDAMAPAAQWSLTAWFGATSD